VPVGDDVDPVDPGEPVEPVEPVEPGVMKVSVKGD
jgi:hypothetical protein